MAATISIVSWDEFQHYRDRDPPWIKLYRDILTSSPWLLGTDISRLVQIALILLAARYKNEIPYSPIILKAAHLDCTKNQLETSVLFLQSVEFIKIQGLNGKALASCYAEQSRAEQSRAEQSRAEQSRAELFPDFGKGGNSIDLPRVIFDHWKATWGHARAQLDAKRRAVINRALKSYDSKTLCDAISGYKNSPHHIGVNDRSTVYDSIDLFLRDAKHIDAGLKHSETPGGVKQPDRKTKFAQAMEAIDRG